MKRNEGNSVEATENTSSIALTEEQENEFVKAVKIGLAELCNLLPTRTYYC